MYQNWLIFLILLFLVIIVLGTRKDGFEKVALSFAFLIFFLIYFLILVILATLLYGDISENTLSGSAGSGVCNSSYDSNCNN